MTVLITHVSSPELFAGRDDRRRLRRVELTRPTGGALPVRVVGVGVSGTADLPPGDGPIRVEVPLEVASTLRAHLHRHRFGRDRQAALTGEL